MGSVLHTGARSMTGGQALCPAAFTQNQAEVSTNSAPARVASAPLAGDVGS